MLIRSVKVDKYAYAAEYLFVLIFMRLAPVPEMHKRVDR